jgi:hypothetical protein
MSEKPTGLQAVAIIAIALGIMGFFGGALGLATLLINPKNTAPNPNPKLKELNAELESRLDVLNRETRPVTRMVLPGTMLLSVLLAGAGIASLKLQGLTFLRVALGANLLADALWAAYNIHIQLKSTSLMTWYFRESGKVVEMPAGVATGMQVGMYTGIFFAGGWLLLKLGYYVWGLVYLGTKPVRATFDGASLPQP